MNQLAPQIPDRFHKPLQIIADRLQGTGIDWAITGSMGWALQGVQLDIHDIDLQTDEEGARRMYDLLSEYSRKELYRRVSERIQSNFAVFEIDGITIEIMGAVQKILPDGQCESPVDIRLHRTWIEYHSLQLPVLTLEYEYRAYNLMGRVEKARMLEPYIWKKN